MQVSQVFGPPGTRLCDGVYGSPKELSLVLGVSLGMGFLIRHDSLLLPYNTSVVSNYCKLILVGIALGHGPGVGQYSVLSLY